MQCDSESSAWSFNRVDTKLHSDEGRLVEDTPFENLGMHEEDERFEPNPSAPLGNPRATEGDDGSIMGNPELEMGTVNGGSACKEA